MCFNLLAVLEMKILFTDSSQFLNLFLVQTKFYWSWAVGMVLIVRTVIGN